MTETREGEGEGENGAAARKATWAAVILLAILHQDVWFWDAYEPLVFGFMPIGLAYHALISILAAVVWFLAIKYCWPRDLEHQVERAREREAGAETARNE